MNTLRRSLFLVSAPMVFIMFGLPLRAEEIGASGFQIGILFSLFTASLLVLRPLVGAGLDRFGRRRFFLTALVFYLLANLLYAFADSLPALYAARAMHGFGFAFLAITADAIAADLSKSGDRAEAMGGNIQSQSRGGMLGATIGFTLVGIAPLVAWRGSFFIYAALAALSLALAWRALPETLAIENRKDQAQRQFFAAGYRRLLVAVFVAALAYSFIQPFYLIYLRARFGLEVYQLAGIFLPVGLVYALFPAFLGRLTGRIDRALVISIGLAVAASFYLFVPITTGFLPLVALFVGAAIGGALIDLTRNAWFADIGGADGAGRSLGAAAFATGLGAAIGPLVGGVLYDRVGPESVFYSASIAYLLSIVILRPYIGAATKFPSTTNQG